MTTLDVCFFIIYGRIPGSNIPDSSEITVFCIILRLLITFESSSNAIAVFILFLNPIAICIFTSAYNKASVISFNTESSVSSSINGALFNFLNADFNLFPKSDNTIII